MRLCRATVAGLWSLTIGFSFQQILPLACCITRRIIMPSHPSLRQLNLQQTLTREHLLRSITHKSNFLAIAFAIVKNTRLPIS